MQTTWVLDGLVGTNARFKWAYNIHSIYSPQPVDLRHSMLRLLGPFEKSIPVIADVRRLFVHSGGVPRSRSLSGCIGEAHDCLENIIEAVRIVLRPVETFQPGNAGELGLRDSHGHVTEILQNAGLVKVSVNQAISSQETK